MGVKKKIARMGEGCLCYVKQTAGGTEFAAVISEVRDDGVVLHTIKLGREKFFSYEELEYVI